MTIAHPLDRPAWAALHSRQAAWAVGQGLAVRFDPAAAIFAAIGDHAPQSLAALGAVVRAQGPAIVIQRDPLPPVPGTRVDLARAAVQMVAEAITPGERAFDPLTLGDSDAPEMLALATETRPGPFFARTHRLGDFVGVRVEGRLVAMAGERLRLEGYCEVSGVCTAPDYRGRGLAGALMRVVAGRMLARGDRPFLHAYADNAGAIALYETLGFRIRSPMVVTTLSPA